jgi:hypothetical protein
MLVGAMYFQSVAGLAASFDGRRCARIGHQQSSMRSHYDRSSHFRTQKCCHVRFSEHHGLLSCVKAAVHCMQFKEQIEVFALRMMDKRPSQRFHTRLNDGVSDVVTISASLCLELVFE